MDLAGSIRPIPEQDLAIGCEASAIDQHYGNPRATKTVPQLVEDSSSP